MESQNDGEDVPLPIRHAMTTAMGLFGWSAHDVSNALSIPLHESTIGRIHNTATKSAPIA